MRTNEIRCEPHPTGLSFEYEGDRYIYGANGFLFIGEEEIYELEADEVPLIIREMAEHWKTFTLHVRIDNLAEWLGCCDFCGETYRVVISARLDYHAERWLKRTCSCGTECILQDKVRTRNDFFILT